MTLAADSHASTGSKLVIPKNLTGESHRWRRVIWGGAVLAGLAVGAVSWGLLARSPTSTYRTEPVQRRTISRQVEALGQVDVPRRMEVSAPAPGRLAQILVAPGQRVLQGQLLGQLDDMEAAQAFGAARGSLKVGESRITEAQAALESAVEVGARTERLATRGLASQADLQAAKAAVKRASAALEVIRAERSVTARAVASAALRREMMAIRAPSDAIVLAVPDRVGAAVSPEAGRLFVLGNTMDIMHIKVSVAEADIADVKPAQSAHFTVPAFPGRVFEARVLRVDPEAQRERSSVTYATTLEAANRPQLLFPGMTASVRIDVAQADDTLAVREAALRFVPPLAGRAPEDNHRSRVWRLRDHDRIEAVAVTPGISDGAYTQIDSQGQQSIQVGDAIVIGVFTPNEPSRAGPGVSLGRH